MKNEDIERALKLVEANGYTVTKKRHDPQIGDVVRCREEGRDVLITLHDTESTRLPFGGGEIMKGPNIYMNHIWIDANLWAKDKGHYTVIGHVDLSKFVTVKK